MGQLTLNGGSCQGAAALSPDRHMGIQQLSAWFAGGVSPAATVAPCPIRARHLPRKT